MIKSCRRLCFDRFLLKARFIGNLPVHVCLLWWGNVVSHQKWGNVVSHQKGGNVVSHHIREIKIVSHHIAKVEIVSHHVVK